MAYRRGDYTIGVGMLPGSKRPSLYVGNKCCIHKVASFSSDDAAEDFKRYLEYFLFGRDNPTSYGRANNEAVD